MQRMTITLALAAALLVGSRPAALADTQVAAAGAGAFPSRAMFQGLSLKSSRFGLGAIRNVGRGALLYLRLGLKRG